jgi:hypothetical protein
MAVAEVFWPTLGKPVLGCFQTEPGLQAGWYFFCWFDYTDFCHGNSIETRR